MSSDEEYLNDSILRFRDKHRLSIDGRAELSHLVSIAYLNGVTSALASVKLFNERPPVIIIKKEL